MLIFRPVSLVCVCSGFNPPISGTNWLHSGICIFVLFTSFFIIRRLVSKKKACDSQLQLAQKEKNEIELQARLKDEMLKKAVLEKYESLLEIHFKNQKISEMDHTVLELKNEQVKLNKQIQNYKDRLLHEQKKFTSAVEDSYFRNIVLDVYTQILKRIDEKDSYLEALQVLKDDFFLNLKNNIQENISVTNIKYCICFAIGMNSEDIAKCFCVERHSVHKIRYRLKSKLKLDKDINLFFKQLNDQIPP